MTAPDVLLPEQTVLVVGDRITAVGPSSRVKVPRRSRRIDATGKYLIPGLADMHVHLEHFRESGVLKLFLANGITTVRNMDGRDYILGWKRDVVAGSLLGPTIYTAGPILDGDPPILPDNTVVRNEVDARSNVAAQASAGYDFVKIYANLSPDAYHAVLKAARARNLPVAGHVPRRIDLSEALAGGQVAIEHLADYGDWIESEESPFRNRWHWSKLYLAMQVDTAKFATAASKIAASGVSTVPTLVQAHRALAAPDTLAAWLSAPEMQHIPDEGRRFWQERNQRNVARMDAGDWVLARRGRPNRERLVRALHAARAGLLVGTDTPNPFVIPGYSVIEELENFVPAGFTPGGALVAATRDAARFFGDSREWGTIEPGRRADLLLLNANPLTVVRNVGQRAGVMVRGRWLPEEQLRAMSAGLVLR